MDGAMTGPSGAPPGIMATVTAAGYRIALPGACMQPSDVLTLLTGLHASLVGRQGSGGGVATPRGRNLCVMGTKTATEWYDISQSDFVAVAAPRCAAGFVAAADSGNSAGSIAADSEARLQDEYSQKLQEVLVKIDAVEQQAVLRCAEAQVNHGTRMEEVSNTVQLMQVKLEKLTDDFTNHRIAMDLMLDKKVENVACMEAHDDLVVNFKGLRDVVSKGLVSGQPQLTVGEPLGVEAGGCTELGSPTHGCASPVASSFHCDDGVHHPLDDDDGISNSSRSEDDDKHSTSEIHDVGNEAALRVRADFLAREAMVEAKRMFDQTRGHGNALSSTDQAPASSSWKGWKQRKQRLARAPQLPSERASHGGCSALDSVELEYPGGSVAWCRLDPELQAIWVAGRQESLTLCSLREW